MLVLPFKVPSRPRSLLASLFAYLVILVGVPVLILLTFSDYALVSTISEEIGKAGIGKLKVASSIDRMLDELVQNTCVRIALDPRIDQLSNVRSYDSISGNGDLQYEFMEYQEELGKLVATNPVFHSIHILLDDCDWVLSSVDGTARRDKFSDRVWLERTLAGDEGELEQRGWIPHTPEAVTLLSTWAKKEIYGEQVVTRLYRLTPYITSLAGWVVININERELSRRINSSNFGQEGSIAIIGSQGTVLSAADNSLVGSDISAQGYFRSIVENGGVEGYLTIPGPTGGNLITWYRPGGDWRIFLGNFSYEILNQNMANVRTLTVLVSLVVLLCALSAAYLVSLRFFNPVRKLARQIMERAGAENQGAEGNELNLLGSAIDALLKRHNQLFYQDDESWVHEVLKGRVPENGIPEAFKTGCSLVAYLLVDGKQAYQARFPAEQRDYHQTLVIHMAQDAFAPYFACRGARRPDDLVALILACPPLDASEITARVKRVFSALQTEVDHVLQTSISLCLGDPVAELSRIVSSLDDLDSLAKHRFLNGPACFLDTGLLAEKPQASPFPRKEERRIIAALEANSVEELSQALQALREQIQGESTMGHDQVRLILFQVLAAVIKHVLELNIRLDGIFGAQADLHAALVACETLDEALDWLGSTCRAIVLWCRQSFQEEPDHSQAIIAFIRENFRHDFGIDTVADHVGLSYSHVRKVFQEKIGDSIVDYVNSLRISEAQRLLTDSDQGLSEIARQVGYNNAQGLNRHFRKQTGVSPGEYRKQRRSST